MVTGTNHKRALPLGEESRRKPVAKASKSVNQYTRRSWLAQIAIADSVRVVAMREKRTEREIRSGAFQEAFRLLVDDRRIT